MRLYLNIALVSLEGSLRRMFLCMKMFIMVHDMYMMNFHIIYTTCWLVLLMNMFWSMLLKYDNMWSRIIHDPSCVTWLNKAMGLCLFMAHVDFIGVVVNWISLFMLKCTLVHDCCYNDLMIELIDYVSNSMICMLTCLDLVLLVLFIHALDLMNVSKWLV